jgi:outer membrane receptor for ferrienterochelin and colicins
MEGRRSVLGATVGVVVFAALVRPEVCAAQQRVVGRVLSSADASPIVSARISIPQGTMIARTNDRGEFVVTVRSGDSLVIGALGFRQQRVASADTLTVRLTPLATTLATVITTVGQREMRSADNPASSVVLTKADIAAANAVSANQLLRQLPGLQELSAPPAQSSIAIRGLDASRVLVLVDGEPAAGGLIENRDIGRLSTLAADRIEVTKGPSSVEFGSDALGGVINLVTAAPSAVPMADILVRSGELGRRESSVALSNTVGPVGVRINGGWRQSDRVTGVNAGGTTLDRVYDMRGDVRYRISDSWRVRSDVQLSQQRQRWPVGGGFNGFIDNHTEQALVEAVGSVRGGSVRARLFGQRYAYQFRQAQAAIPIAGTADSLEQTETLGRGLLSYSRVIGNGTLDVGAQYSNRRIEAPNKIDGNRATDEVTELFARHAVTLGDVLVSAGARSTTSTLWGSTVSPSLGAIWHTSPTVQLRANLARGFRAPSFKEMRYTFLNANAGYTLIGNPNLTPESSWSSVVAASWAPVANLLLSAEAYRNEVRDLVAIRATGFTTAGLQIFENTNVARARTEGVEFAMRASHGASSLSAGYDYLRARDRETGRTLDGRARHTARVALQHDWLQRRGLVSDLAVRYTGSAPVGTTMQQAFLSIDGQLRSGFARGLEAMVGVTNLLNQRPAGWTPAFQRQLVVGVNARWMRTPTS